MIRPSRPTLSSSSGKSARACSCSIKGAVTASFAPTSRSCKRRGQGTAYSGIEKPLFFRENIRMFYGDAKKSIDGLILLVA
ncbi:hypothetical protein ELH20_29670 (plasmid) [Rhizobium ruizarguesonis]|nr:hypothetical protein ELH20_29670 [Rhizobium ruizarguesonis]